MSDTPRRWLGLRLRTLVWLLLLTTVGYSVYSYWSDYADRAAIRDREQLTPSRGAVCTVVLRRDALGVERMSPSPSTVDGVANSVSGQFRMMNDQWIVLDGINDDLPQQWIPQENVLLIQVSPP